MTIAQIAPVLTSPLCLGNHGSEVKALQNALNEARLGPVIQIDGRFGKATHKALVAYQRSKGVKPDGVVGPKTAELLGFGYRPGRNLPYVISFEEPMRPAMTPPLRVLIDQILIGMKPIEETVIYSIIETPTVSLDPMINLRQREFMWDYWRRLEQSLEALATDIPEGTLAVATLRAALQRFVDNAIFTVETMQSHASAGYLWRFPDVLRKVPVDSIAAVVDRVLRGELNMTMAMAQLRITFETVKTMLDLMPRVDANGRALGQSLEDVGLL